MSEFKFVKNGAEFDYSTKTVEVEELVTVKVRKALWKSMTERLSVEELNALGVQLKFVPTQTNARLDYEHITALYTAVPVFAQRVGEWKAMYDELGIPYSAGTAAIEAAELEKFGDDEAARGQFHDRFMAKRTDVMVNYQAAERAYCNVTDSEFGGIDDYTTWTDFPTLVKWIPGSFEESEIPARREEEIIESSDREEEIRADLAAENNGNQSIGGADNGPDEESEEEDAN